MGLIVPNIELVIEHFEPYVIGQPLQRNNWQGGNESPFQPLSLAIAPILITSLVQVKVFYRMSLPNVFCTHPAVLGLVGDYFLCSFALLNLRSLGVAWPIW